ncbi:MAG: thiamine diphosphokinase, partial [Candidatus Eremiobacteraeota bacterium]|nr:thiamine diphosphokinase [Candidatus Eremiobacteraeota bacterium]
MIGRIIIIASGIPPGASFLKSTVSPDDFIIAVDGGSLACLNAGIIPDMVIGDLDSIGLENMEKLKSYNVTIAEYPVEKNKTDLEIAFDFALNKNPEKIDVLGALGKRIDHLVGNIMLLHGCKKSGVPARIIDEKTEIFLAGNENFIEGKPGDIVSLIPLSEKVTGIV